MSNEIETRNLASFGWKTGPFSESRPFTSQIIYIHDFRTKYTELVTVTEEDFAEVKTEKDIEKDESVNFIARVMLNLSKGKMTELEAKALVPVIVNYIKKTLVYTQWVAQKADGERLHLVMNIYRAGKQNKDSVRLRPFILRPVEIMLTAAEIKDFTYQVHARDRKERPDWF